MCYSRALKHLYSTLQISAHRLTRDSGDRRVDGKRGAATRLARGRPRHNSTNRGHGMGCGNAPARWVARRRTWRGENKEQRKRGAGVGGEEGIAPIRAARGRSGRGGQGRRRGGKGLPQQRAQSASAEVSTSQQRRSSAHTSAGSFSWSCASACSPPNGVWRGAVHGRGCAAWLCDTRAHLGQPSANPRPTLGQPSPTLGDSSRLSRRLSATLARLVV